MSVNGVNNQTTTYTNTDYKAGDTGKKNDTSSQAAAPKADTAAVYESTASQSTDPTKTIYKRDNAAVNQLKQDLKYRQNQLRGLVEKLMTKQADKSKNYTDMYQLLRSGNLEVDSATAAQAKKDISEDGYWGVEQTSQRLFDMAVSLSGGDPSKADKMIDAMKEGFKQATKAWGDKLPDISQQTIDSAIKKMEDWKKSFTE